MATKEISHVKDLHFDPKNAMMITERNIEAIADREVLIYALSGGLTEEVRYVGKTVKLKSRLGDHLRSSKRKENRHAARWLGSLVASGKYPKVEVLEVVRPGDDWGEAEKQWIEFFRIAGARLTNHTDGGEGMSGHIYSDSHRANIGKSNLGKKHSLETKQKMRDRFLGIPLSSEHKKKLKEARAKFFQTDQGATLKADISRKYGKLTDEEVVRVRQVPSSWGVVSRLAKEYGVSSGVMSEIRNGKRYKHVK
jgi:hypothetical protein